MMYVSIMLRNVAVTSRRNVTNQRSYVIIIVRKEGGVWEHTPQVGSSTLCWHHYEHNR